MHFLARFTGHVFILAVCVVAGMLTSGRYLYVDYKIGGVDLVTLGPQRAADLIVKGEELEATSRIVLAHRTYTVEGNWSFCVALLVLAIGLALVYAPGFLWRSARHFGVRLPIVFGWAGLVAFVPI